MKVSGPAIELSEKQINLGFIQNQNDLIIGTIPVFNPGTETLEIKKVSGPCTCFKGYSGDRSILPGQGGEVEVRFDPAQIPAGKAKRLVRIETNDPKHPTTELNIAFELRRTTEQEQNRQLLTEVTKLRTEVASLRKEVDTLNKQPSSSARPKTASKPENDTRTYDIPAGDSPVFGSADAPIIITLFSDFQCPYCIKEFPKIQQVIAEYPDKVKVVYKHFPLAFHKQAPAAHTAAIMAWRQKGNDGFWKMHDMILSDPKKLDTGSLRIYAEALGLDTVELDKAWTDSNWLAEQVKADKELAAQCNVRGTPTVFINGKKLADRSLDGYRARVNEFLSGKIALSSMASNTRAQ